MGNLPKRYITMNWGDFLSQAIKNWPNETCGFLFGKNLYREPDGDGSGGEEWMVITVKNIAEKPTEAWTDRKEMQAAKKKARKLGYVKMGNVHTHPYPPIKEKISDESSRLIGGAMYDKAMKPSETDLRFARKFNDIVRGIVVVDKDTIYGARWHDQFGNEIPVHVEGIGRG